MSNWHSKANAMGMSGHSPAGSKANADAAPTTSAIRPDERPEIIRRSATKVR